MGPTRVNRKLSFESGEEQIKGYGKVTQNTEIFSTKYGNNILEVGSPVLVSLPNSCGCFLIRSDAFSRENILCFIHPKEL